MCVQVVMWLNQNFLLPEGVDSPDVTFNSLRGGGLLSINMTSNGQVQFTHSTHVTQEFLVLCLFFLLSYVDYASYTRNKFKLYIEKIIKF